MALAWWQQAYGQHYDHLHSTVMCLYVPLQTRGLYGHIHGKSVSAEGFPKSAGVLTSPDFTEIFTHNLLQYGRHVVVSQLLPKKQK